MQISRMVLLIVAMDVLLGATAVGLGIKYWPMLSGALYSGHSQKAKKPKKPDIHIVQVEPVATAGLALGEAIKTWDFARDEKAFDAFDVAVQTRFRKKHFQELDQWAENCQATKGRFPGGRWKLYQMVNALGEHPGGRDSADADWGAHLKLFEEWISVQPDSPIARVAYADALTDYAWKARGGGWASEVTDEGWRAFKERLQKARETLEAQPAKRRCPMWYRIMQTVALGQGWKREDYEKLFEEGVTREPLFQPLYTAKAYYLLPRWHGEEGEWEAFARQAADKIGGQEGDAMYYFIYNAQRSILGYNKYLEKDKTPWPRMKRGFAGIESLYGMTPGQLNEYCRNCGGACDKEEAKRVLNRIGDRFDKSVWRSKANIDDFLDWAHCRGKYSGSSATGS